MNLKFTFFLAFCAILAHCKPTPSSLVYIGDVDGKAFYEEDTRMNWRQALLYCEQNGLKLAKVESEAQADFLGRVLKVSPGHWVSAKTFGDGDSNYEWDGFGAHKKEEILWTDDPSGAGLCAYFFSYDPSLFLMRCGESVLGTICEGIGNSTNSPIESPRGVKARAYKPKTKLAKKKEAPLDWLHLGDIENKAFYSLDRRVHWEEAFNLCEQSNMTLGRVETKTQADFLAGRVQVDNKYWIASKDIDDEVGWDKTWNTTGFYSRLDITWTDEGRVGGPNSRCGFYGNWDNYEFSVKPRAELAWCTLDEYDCLCTQQL